MDSGKGIKSIVVGIAGQVITVLLGFIIPRLVLVNLGSEANGLMNSISTVLTYLALLEAGVGTATIQALYRPVAEDDRSSINSILSATSHFYQRTGTIYLALVLLLAGVFAVFIDTSIPRYQVFLVVLMSGLSGVISYYFQGKFRLLLTAEGKKYIITGINTTTHVGVSIFKAVVLLAGGSVAAVQGVYFVFNLLQMLVYYIYARKHYSWINYKAVPDFEAISQRNSVLVHQAATLIFRNTDVVLLTIFTSLKTVSVYSMYAMIYGMIGTITGILVNSFNYMLGQSFRNKERFNKIYNVYEVNSLAVTTSFFCIARILAIPFLKLYTAGVSDISYIDPMLPWLFVIFYLLDNGRMPSAIVLDIAQEFKNTQNRAILETVINLTVSLVLTFSLGIYGVLLGTIAALLYRTNDMIIYTARLIKRSPWITYRRWLINLCTFAVVSYAASMINIDIENYVQFVLYGGTLAAAVIAVFICTNWLFNRDAAKIAVHYVSRIVKERLKKHDARNLDNCPRL